MNPTPPTPTGPAQEASDTGGPAFPRETNFANYGMTLLDYFAGQALSSGDFSEWSKDNSLAERCYECAEAMIAEKRRRERPPATAQGENEV